jgi:GNAT superfamily N-acetyltransferase
MSGELTIRPFRASDAPALAATVAAVYREYGFRFDPDGYDKDLSIIEERYLRPGGVFFTADLEGRAVGFAGADVPRPGTAELHRVYIDARARGRGLGARLVTEVEAWARARRLETVELWSDVRLGHAHAMYARLGYALFGQRQLWDIDRSLEFGFRRGLAGVATPVVHELTRADRAPLAGFLGTELEHRVRMLAAGILDSRTLVTAGRMVDGGHALPDVGELFEDASIDDVVVVSIRETLVGFERGRERRLHPLFERF